jgi:hypothetical protein
VGTYDAVEFTPFVALRAAIRGFAFAGAELAEVFGGFGRFGGKEFDFYATERLAWEC